MLGSLKFNDEELFHHADDKLYKIRGFLENIQANFLRYAEPERVSSIDEIIVPFKVSLNEI